MNNINVTPAGYLRRLHLRNIKCFKQEYDISFADNEGKPAFWTVFLGNNNTGKTTLLRLLGSHNLLNKRFLESSGKEVWNSIRSLDKKGVTHYWITEVITQDKNTYSLEQPIALTAAGDSFSPKYHDMSDTVSRQGRETFQFIDGYGVSRKPSDAKLIDYANFSNTTKGLFFDNELLVNVEAWLLQLDYATKSNKSGANTHLKQLKDLVLSQIFPDLLDIRFETEDNFEPFVSFLTTYGWIRLKDLSYGYQTTIAWVIDLAKRMFDRYPDLDNPLHGPAIVLVDEIDLHLHPEWQRKIIKYLSDLFPNTQFIVTAHSPLIVQSAENVNLIMLEKDDETGSINIRQQFGSFQGWTVEEILRELMDMGEKTRSDRYLELMRQFEDGLLSEDYASVKSAYEELDKILSPSSHQRKVLQIQMSSLIPA